MSEIKAIETVYGGYRFRSRLEARWAVFFDAAGIRYEYEKEGFELPSGARYLPDFWLPQFDVWVETKPTIEALDRDGGKSFDFHKTGAGWMLIIGDPWPTSSILTGRGDVFQFVKFTQCSASGQVVLVPFNSEGFESDAHIEHALFAFTSHNIMEAFRKARGARFEHGEKPNT